MNSVCCIFSVNFFFVCVHFMKSQNFKRCAYDLSNIDFVLMKAILLSLKGGFQ